MRRCNCGYGAWFMAVKFAGFNLESPLIMGIVNVTPDSFSDGGETFKTSDAISRAIKYIDSGANIIDVGGQSTKPQSQPISVRQELERILPVVKWLVREGVSVSVDTYKAEVMEAVLDEGVKIINDVSALTADKRSLEVIASAKASVVLMHMRGNPHNMMANTNYKDVVSEVWEYLDNRIKVCVNAGIDLDCIAVDPGIGFSKNTKDNYTLIDNLEFFESLPCSKLIGVSRKFGVNKIASDRLDESISLGINSIRKGINILRVHDVLETRRAIDLWLLERNQPK